MGTEGNVWLNRLSRRQLLKYGVVAGAGLAVSDVLAACGVGDSGTSGSSIQMKLGSDSPLSSTHTLAMVTLKKEIEAKTNGRIKCAIYPDGQLGGNDVMLNSIKQGSLDGVIIDVQVTSSAVPESGIFSLPFLFNDSQQALRAANGPTGAAVKPKIEAAFGCQLLGWGNDGERNMWNSKHPIRTPADLKGLKMRCQNDPIQRDTYSSFGALPAFLSFTEIYGACQTGVIDGSDAPVTDMVASKFYEVTKYMTFTRHLILVQPVVVSEKFMAKLSSADQDVVRAAGKVAAEANVTATLQAGSADTETLKTKGIQVVEMANKQAFVDVVQNVYTKNASRVGGLDAIAQARNTV